MLTISGWQAQRFNASNDLTLRYVKLGSGAPLVLMHTIRTQAEYFRDLAPQLAQTFTVYVVDLPGHGYSSLDPNAPCDEPYMRKAITSFIMSLDLRDVTIAGESIGAVLALTVAAEVPDRIRAVYALNTYDYETRFADGIRRGNWFANFILSGLQIPVFGPIAGSLEDRFILRKIMEGGYADPRKLPPDLLTEFASVSRQPRYRRVARKVLQNWRSWSDARERYAGIKAPVTLIYGDKDWSRPYERERTRSLLPNVSMITIPNTGHFASVENPTEVARLILA